MKDINGEIQALQSDIALYLRVDIDNLVFSFKQKDDVIRLDLITINPNHDQSFLFHTTKAEDKLGALKKMVDYIRNQYNNDDTFTLQWMKIGESTLHTSYFRAKNIYEVLDKFFFERDLNSYRIYGITLNPIS